MVSIGYAARLEQLAPMEAVELAVHAESAGFSGVAAADHFQPWTPRQGQAPFVWNVLSVIGDRTAGDLGPGVTTPTFRMHPAVVAQASATLAAMFPGRHWLGLGSGEALNEHVVGSYWPEPAERIERLFEAVDIIRKLFTGKEVQHRGPHYRMERSRLWTMPEVPPEILIATAGPVTARRAGQAVDGLITSVTAPEKLDHLLARFAEGLKLAGKDQGAGVRALMIDLSWAPTQAEAVGNALTEWPHGGLRFPTADIRSPHQLEQMARSVRVEDFADRVIISDDPDVHRAHIQRFIDLGIDRIYLHNVGRNQRDWLTVFGREVLPSLRS